LSIAKFAQSPIAKTILKEKAVKDPKAFRDKMREQGRAQGKGKGKGRGKGNKGQPKAE
jgi:hypothetical protein